MFGKYKEILTIFVSFMENLLRKEFPILDDKVCGKLLIYFDNAATSQRPLSVVRKMEEMNLHHNANIHRAVHTLSADATAAYEAGREAARKFINAPSREEVIITYGTTTAINLVANSFSEAFIGQGDEIIVGEAEHHSNLVPWQQVALRKGAVVKYLRLNERGMYDLENLKSLLSPKTRIACFNQASNVLGLLNPVKEMIELCHESDVPVMLDGAQGAVHCHTDVQDLDCDFYAFSAHKIFGPTGVGILYGKKEYLDRMPPFLCGGEMVGTVSLEGTTFAPLPMKFEAGTQNFVNVAAFPEALKLASKVLNDNELNEELERIKRYLYDSLKAFEGLHLYGDPHEGDWEKKLPIFSFTIDGVHHEDLAILLDKMGVAVRSGQMCAEPLMTHFSVTGMLRISLLQYNTMQEAEQFVKCLERAVNMLK